MSATAGDTFGEARLEFPQVSISYSVTDPLQMMYKFLGRRTRRAALALIVLFSFDASAAEKVALQLRWDHRFQFAGYYAALWQGYYADAGLDVEIRSAFTEERKILSVRPERS